MFISKKHLKTLEERIRHLEAIQDIIWNKNIQLIAALDHLKRKLEKEGKRNVA